MTQSRSQRQSLTREYCFQYLFHLQMEAFEILREEMSKSNDDSELGQDLENYDQSGEILLSEAEKMRAFNMIKSVIHNYQEINQKLEEKMTNWKLDRVSKVDHTILLLGVAEFLYLEKTPKQVVINECIELAKKYGQKESPKFINGILDGLF